MSSSVPFITVIEFDWNRSASNLIQPLLEYEGTAGLAAADFNPSQSATTHCGFILFSVEQLCYWSCCQLGRVVTTFYTTLKQQSLHHNFHIRYVSGMYTYVTIEQGVFIRTSKDATHAGHGLRYITWVTHSTTLTSQLWCGTVFYFSKDNSEQTANNISAHIACISLSAVT